MSFDLGDTRYLVDFYLPKEHLWIEVKGFATTRFKYKLSKPKEIHNVAPLMIDIDVYRKLEKFYASRIPEWEVGKGYGIAEEGMELGRMIALR